MGSDPGSDLPKIDQNYVSKENSGQEIASDRDRCSICGLVARNQVELDEHMKHAHKQGDSNKTGKVYSDEQKIDPFVKTQD